MVYHRRIVDETLDEFLPHLTAVAIEGAKGVGKTATAAERSMARLALDDPAQLASLEADLGLITWLESPVLIDEWQLHPPVWDRVRREVDERSESTYVLTGSAAPPTGARLHSGAGRIIRILMRPLSMVERGAAKPAVAFSQLLSDDGVEIRGETDFALPDYVDEIMRSGFPGMRDLPARVCAAQLDAYVDRIVDRELPEAGLLVRRPAALRRWLTAYAAASATNANYTAILNAATAGEPEKPARTTVDGYREFLTRLFILDPLEAWTPRFTPLKRLTAAPKHHLVDPALAARLVGVGRQGLLLGESGHAVVPRAGTWLGALFESLVTQSVRVYAEANGARVGHLRTKNTDHEIDLIVERPDGGIVAVEVKLAATVDDRDVRHLNWLQAELGDQVLDRIVITTGPFAYRRADGVGVVPLALLGP
ncbi:MAG: DUF4143 domain-containing protein [Leucobacter sp.]